MSAEPPVSGSTGRSATAFVLGTALASIGGALGLISATGITTAAGGQSGGALDTGAYLAINLAAGSLGVPYVPGIAHRLGTRRAFAWLLAIVAIAWTAAGLLMLAGLPALPVMLALSPVIGAATSMSATLAPLVDRAYLSSVDTSSVVARMSVVKGVSWGIGSVLGGVILSSEPSVGSSIGSWIAPCVLLAGLLKFPVVLALARSRPRQPIADLIRPTSAWGAAMGVLRQHRALRALALLAIGMGLFASPVLLMAVPIAQALTPSVQYQAAGLLLASYALGQLLSPLVVARLRRGQVLVKASARAALGTGIALITGGVVAVTATLLLPVVPATLHLMGGAVLGLSLGAIMAACRFGARALILGAAAETLGRDRAATPLAAVRLCGTLAAPVGVLAWGAILGSQGAGLALAVGGLGIVVIAMIVLRTNRMDAAVVNR